MRVGVIREYRLTFATEQAVDLPSGAQVLSAAMVGEELFLFALAEPGAQNDTCTVRIYGTGGEPRQPVDPFTRLPESERDTFLGTCVSHGGMGVWHVFYTMMRSGTDT